MQVLLYCLTTVNREHGAVVTLFQRHSVSDTIHSMIFMTSVNLGESVSVLHALLLYNTLSPIHMLTLSIFPPLVSLLWLIVINLSMQYYVQVTTSLLCLLKGKEEM